MAFHFRTVAATAALFMFCSGASARDVRVGIFPAAPLVLEANGAGDGLFMEILRTIADKRDWNLIYVAEPWAQLLEDLAKGTIDLLPAVSFTTARQAVFDFSDLPIFIDSGVLYTRTDFYPHTIFELNQRRIAAVKASVFTKAFEDYLASFSIHAQIDLVDTNEAVMKAIVSGRDDAGVSIYSLGTDLQKRYQVASTAISFSPLALHFAVPKGRNPDVLAAINADIARMSSDPNSSYKGIFEKWMQSPAQFVWPVWLSWLLGISAAALGVFGIATLILRRQVRVRTAHLKAEIAERVDTEARLKASLEEKSILIQELYHRTKNTLQVVRGLLYLQADAYPDNVDLHTVVKNTDGRLQAISIVHSMLYRARDLSNISVPDYLRELSSLTIKGYQLEANRVSIQIDAEDLTFEISQAIPLGIIVNELITNSIKHGFLGEQTWEITIGLRRVDEKEILFSYHDNGRGMSGSEAARTQTLGLSLIRNLVERQLFGIVRFENDSGLRCSFSIRPSPY